MKIPMKKKDAISEETFAHSVNLNAALTVQFARVREVLGGYSSAELLEILVQQAVDSYYDGKMPRKDLLPKRLIAPVMKADKQELKQSLMVIEDEQNENFGSPY